MMIRDPNQYRKKPDPLTWGDMVELFIGFWVAVVQMFTGCMVFLAGLFGCAVSTVFLIVFVGAVVMIVAFLMSGSP